MGCGAALDLVELLAVHDLEDRVAVLQPRDRVGRDDPTLRAREVGSVLDVWLEPVGHLEVVSDANQTRLDPAHLLGAVRQLHEALVTDDQLARVLVGDKVRVAERPTHLQLQSRRLQQAAHHALGIALQKLGSLCNVRERDLDVAPAVSLEKSPDLVLLLLHLPPQRQEPVLALRHRHRSHRSSPSRLLKRRSR